MTNKNIEEQSPNENKRSFNLADVIIIIIAIALIAAFVLRTYNVLDADKDVQDVRISFRVTGISENTDLPRENSPLYKSSDNAYAGYIEKFSVTDMTVYAYTEEGELVEAKVPGKVTLRGTVVLQCVKTEKGFYLGGTQLLTVGDVISFYTADREMQVEILSIDVKQAAETTGTSASTQATTVTSASTSSTTADTVQQAPES